MHSILFTSLKVFQGLKRVEHEVMASLDHIDAGEAVIGQAKTPIREGSCVHLSKFEQLASLLKEFEDVVPTLGRLFQAVPGWSWLGSWVWSWNARTSQTGFGTGTVLLGWF
jgi:hypothetical protein